MSRVFHSSNPDRIIENAEDIRNHLLGKVARGTKGLIGAELELFLLDKEGKPAGFTPALFDRLQEKFGDDSALAREKGANVGLTVKNLGNYSIEPGGQMEIATDAANSLEDLRDKVAAMHEALKSAAETKGLSVVGTGHIPAYKDVEDAPRSRFAAYYEFCRSQHGAPAEDLIQTMKSACGLQINLDPMGDDFHEVYRAMMLVELAHSFANPTARKQRLQNTYANLFPEQVTPMFNATAARNNDQLVGMIVERLLTIRVPFVPDGSAEGFASTIDLYGTPPTVGELMKRGLLTEKILDNSLSLQMTTPNLRGHGVLENRAPDSVNTVDEVMDIARTYQHFAYDAQARRRLLAAFEGIEADKLQAAHGKRFNLGEGALMGTDIGGGKTVGDLIASIQPTISNPKPAQKQDFKLG